MRIASPCWHLMQQGAHICAPSLFVVNNGFRTASRGLGGTPPCSEISIAQYDFQRYKDVYNNGKQIRFPLKSMDIAPFVRPEMDESDEDVLVRKTSLSRPLDLPSPIYH